MKILALDTSTEYLSLALWLNGESYSRELLAGQSHSQRILPLLKELLAEANISLHDLDGIAFGAGPGSFTGLRIGCGVAQGLAFGANLPVVGVSTLQALAHVALAANASADKVIACLDARMGEVYHAAYIKNDNSWLEVSAATVVKPALVPALQGTDWLGAGSGWAAYGEVLGLRYANQVGIVLPALFPSALAIAALARPLLEAEQGKPAAEAAPIYIRNKVAFSAAEREQMAAQPLPVKPLNIQA